MALTHHVIIRAAGVQCGINNFQDYLVLGDDVVIASHEVSKAYIKIIGDIGVGITLSKSVIRNDNRFGVEFASRYIIENGVDISPLPIGNLFEPTTERMFSL